MELPFYLISQESPGHSWDGVVSLRGDDLHFELQGAEEETPTAFDIPLQAVHRAEFQRGLVSRKLSLLVCDDRMRGLFPAGVAGEEVQLMVARDDAEFGLGPGREAEFERLAGTISQRTGTAARESSPGLAS